MGTEVSVYLWHDDPKAGQQAVDAIFSEIARLDQLMSTYIEDSPISEINRNAAEGPVDTGDELLRLIVRSLDISVLTRGAFDITYDSVGQHYDFREGKRPEAMLPTRERSSRANVLAAWDCWRHPTGSPCSASTEVSPVWCAGPKDAATRC